jgi:hypothetical protein
MQRLFCRIKSPPTPNPQSCALPCRLPCPAFDIRRSLLCLACLACLTACRLPQRPATQSFYPLGIYAVNSTNDFATVKSAGFNLIVDHANQIRLDAAQAAGLRVLATPNTQAGPKFNPNAVRQAVKAWDRHPALWAWYLVDEPDLNQISPGQVIQAHRCVKNAGACKPTALVLYQGYEALHYGNLADITMIDRYPVPWLPLANFGQHINLTRLGLKRNKPLIAVIQAFDWKSCPEMLPGETNLRPPTGAEMRCMTYEALARGATGLFYFAFDTGNWKIREHPETWAALQSVVKEVKERQPLFEAQPQWWPKNHRFGDPARRFNAALESSISSTLLRVSAGNAIVPAGDYILAVNNTAQRHDYSFSMPATAGERSTKADGRWTKKGDHSSGIRQTTDSSQTAVTVLGEGRTIQPGNGWLQDSFDAYAVHVYGPLR